MWEDLDRSMLKNGRTIRSIWIADVSYQGASGLLNEEYKYENGNNFAFPVAAVSRLEGFETALGT